MTWQRSEWDKWENEAYSSNVTAVGAVKGWKLDCFEEGLGWPSSVIKHFEDIMDAGNYVTFEITDAGDLHSMSEAVYISECRFDLDLASDTTTPHRGYSLTLRRK